MTDRSSWECDTDNCGQCDDGLCDHECHAFQWWTYANGWRDMADEEVGAR